MSAPAPGSTMTMPTGFALAAFEPSAGAGAVRSYPETRIGAFDFYVGTCTEPLWCGSADAQRACGNSWPRNAEGLCCFSQEDPIRSSQPFVTGGYLYVVSNPIRYRDPRGLWMVDPSGALFPDENTVICDGNGHVIPWIGAPGTQEQRQCLAGCILEHELSHVADITVSQPWVCEGRPRGIKVGSGLGDFRGETAPSERRAYDVERDCLKRLKVADPGDRRCCKKFIEPRLSQLAAERKQYER